MYYILYKSQHGTPTWHRAMTEKEKEEFMTFLAGIGINENEVVTFHESDQLF